MSTRDPSEKDFGPIDDFEKRDLFSSNTSRKVSIDLNEIGKVMPSSLETEIADVEYTGKIFPRRFEPSFLFIYAIAYTSLVIPFWILYVQISNTNNKIEYKIDSIQKELNTVMQKLDQIDRNRP